MGLKIDTDVMGVLSGAVLAGPTLKILDQLDRKLYVKTNKVLEAIGGKWDRKAGAHVFSSDVSELLDPIFLTGEYTDAKKEFEAFYTPPDLAARVVAEAGIRTADWVLEPSAGIGCLALAAQKAGADVMCVEINPKDADHLRSQGFNVHEGDFLRTPTDLFAPAFDRIVMNPPFSGGQEARHVLHALKFLKPGGRLVSIMSAGIKFRQDSVYRQVREISGIEIEDLPAGSFKTSGTSVNTCIVTIDND